jgi:hypothetical protein
MSKSLKQQLINKGQKPVQHVVRCRQNRSPSHLNLWQQCSIITLKTNHARPWHRILFNNAAWWEVSVSALESFIMKVSTNLFGHAYWLQHVNANHTCSFYVSTPAASESGHDLLWFTFCFAFAFLSLQSFAFAVLLLCFSLLCFTISALLCFALLCFALRCSALLCSDVLRFDVLCSAAVICSVLLYSALFCPDFSALLRYFYLYCLASLRLVLMPFSKITSNASRDILSLFRRSQFRLQGRNI